MKKFFVLWSSQAASIFGSAVVGFALAWYLAKETGSATVLSTAMIISFLPQIILGPLVGPLIDRWDRKKIMIFSDLATALFTLMLVLLFLAGTIRIWHIYVAMVGRAIGQVFQNPALGASIPMIVPEKQLVRANGLFQMLQNAIQIIAPIAGAFLLDEIPMQGVLAVDIVTAVIAIGCLVTLGIPRPERATLTVKPKYFSEMREGFRYIWARPGLISLIGMVTLLVFFATPAAYLFPILVDKHLGGDVIKLGWIVTAQGIGGIAGGLILGAWDGFKKRIWTLLTGFAMMIPFSIVIGFTSPQIFYFTTVEALVFMGIGRTFVNAPMYAILNNVIAKDMQGRVFATQGSIVTLMMPLSLVIAGPVADALDVRWLYWIASIAWAVVLSLAFLSKPLMNLENQKTDIKPTIEPVSQTEN